MTVKVAINGFGRIGRLVLRSMIEHNRTDIEVVGINDLGPAATNAHLLKYDSVHGKLNADVSVDGDCIVINGKKIKVTAERDPNNLPWKDLGVDVAMECTGIFTSKEIKPIRYRVDRSIKSSDHFPVIAEFKID